MTAQTRRWLVYGIAITVGLFIIWVFATGNTAFESCVERHRELGYGDISERICKDDLKASSLGMDEP